VDDPLLSRPVWLLVLRQGLPMALGMACHALFNLVDLWMVGKFGEDAVAGVHCATTINFLPMILGNGVSVATMALMAQALGQGDRARAARLSSWSQAAMLAAGLVLGLVGALLAGPSVDIQAVEGPARACGVDYLVVTSLGTFTMFGLMQTTASMRANGEAWMPFALLVGANLLNLGLNFPLMYGWDAVGLAGLGPVGAAWASGASRLLASLCGYAWLCRPGHPLRLRVADLWRAPAGAGGRILDLALPQSVQMLARISPVVILTALAGRIAGNPAITALGVTTRLDTVVLFAAIGFASAGTAVAGRAVGAGRPERARQAARQAGIQAVVLGAVLIGLLAAFAPPLIGLFVDDVGRAVLDAGTEYMRIAAWGHPLAAFCIAATGAFNGAGKTLPPMILDLCGLFLLFLPAGALLVACVPGAELGALWGIVLFTQLALLVAYAVYLERGRWLEGRTVTVAD
jgi:putative MATE family efflux protein